ncbi:MAG: hypothetical protein SPLUMA1_SPLUMAMAG1_00476 [uncultured Sulfurimonas sp.]|nr:MAG: hypothetical protein SPLUMA1_SPLUMAMAG1_00476 [uncultured Sulfurimonas sp.]
MQRKNNTIRQSSHRNAMAIVVMVIISTILALSISLTATTSKKTTDLYLYEQSILLSKSATEYAILKMGQNNTDANPCNYTNETFIHDNIYSINISVRYVSTNFPVSCAAVQYTTVITPEQSGSALVDVTVTVPDDINITSEEIRYFRRTIQNL